MSGYGALIVFLLSETKPSKVVPRMKLGSAAQRLYSSVFSVMVNRVLSRQSAIPSA